MMILGAAVLASDGAPQAPQAQVSYTTQIQNAWQPDQAGMFISARRLAPQLIAVAVNNPPVTQINVQEQAQVAGAWQPDPAAYQFDGGRAPFVPAKLPPSVIAVAVSSPPAQVAQDERPYDNWWISADLPPQLTVKLAQGPPLGWIPASPVATRHLATRQWWVDPDLLPALPRYAPPPQTAAFVPSSAPAPIIGIVESWVPPSIQIHDTKQVLVGSEVDSPQPFSQSILYKQIQHLWAPQPVTIINAPQVLSAVEVDSPPPGNVPVRLAITADLMTAWVPPDPAAITGEIGAPVSSIPAPPPKNAPTRPWFWSVLTAWIPPDPPPIVAGKLNPSAEAVSVNRPPVGNATERPWLTAVLTTWIPPDPPPIVAGNVNASVEAVAVNVPPINEAASQGIYNSFGGGDPSAIMWAQLPPAVFTIPVNFPPFNEAASQGIYNSFGGSDPTPIMWVQLPPILMDVPQVVVVKTAFSSPQNIVLSSWVPSDPAPILASLIAALLPSVQFVASGPPDISGILASWISDQPTPISARALNPAFEAICNAPGRRPDRLASIVASWVPPDPVPIVAESINPAISAIAVNNPPVSGGATTTPALVETLAWSPVDVGPPPPRQRILPQPPPVAPPYIPSRSTALSTIVASWVVADSAPIQQRFVPQAPVAAPPAFLASPNAARAAAVVSAWAPDLAAPIAQRTLQVQGAAPIAATPTAAYYETVVGSWPDAQTLPITGVKLTPAPPRVDLSQVSTKTLAQAAVVDQWLAPSGLLPVLPDLASPSVLAVEVDNPPIAGAYLDNLSTVLTAWTPSPYDPWFAAIPFSYSAPPPPPTPGSAIFEAIGPRSQEAAVLRSGIGQISTS